MISAHLHLSRSTNALSQTHFNKLQYCLRYLIALRQSKIRIQTYPSRPLCLETTVLLGFIRLSVLVQFSDTLHFQFQGTIKIVASSIALSAGIMVHSLILNITPRLFATNVRGIACGCCHASGQIGSTISYILFLLEPRNEITFLAVVTVSTITLVGLCLVLPNVDGRELPDVMEDMNYYSE